MRLVAVHGEANIRRHPCECPRFRARPTRRIGARAAPCPALVPGSPSGSRPRSIRSAPGRKPASGTPGPALSCQSPRSVTEYQLGPFAAGRCSAGSLQSAAASWSLTPRKAAKPGRNRTTRAARSRGGSGGAVPVRGPAGTHRGGRGTRAGARAVNVLAPRTPAAITGCRQPDAELLATRQYRVQMGHALHERPPPAHQLARRVLIPRFQDDQLGSFREAGEASLERFHAPLLVQVVEHIRQNDKTWLRPFDRLHAADIGLPHLDVYQSLLDKLPGRRQCRSAVGACLRTP